MQASTPNQTGAVRAGQAPIAPTSITVPGPDGKPQTLSVPTTRSEMEQLVRRREQLSDQLDNVSDRRGGIVEALRVAPEPAVPGLTAQLKVLDDRIVQLETDLATTGRQVSAASPELTALAEEPSARQGDDEFAPGVAVGSVSTLTVLSAVWLVMRRRWRKRLGARADRSADQITGDSSQRLVRLEQGMDAIALEVERISEGQRFVTKLLSESQRAIAPLERRAESAAVSQKVRSDEL